MLNFDTIQLKNFSCPILKLYQNVVLKNELFKSSRYLLEKVVRFNIFMSQGKLK